MSRQETGPVSAAFRRNFTRTMLTVAISAMSVAVQLGLHGAIAGRYVKNVGWRKLHAWLSLSAASVFIPAAITAYLLVRLLPDVAAKFDLMLPFTVRPTPIATQRKRRDSDADEDAAAEVDEWAATYNEVAAVYGHFVAGVVTWLQEPDMADNVLTGFLTVIWHLAMAGPATVWVFDTGLRGEPRMVFQGLVIAAGLLMASIDIWTLLNCGFWVYPGRKATDAGVAQAGRGKAGPAARVPRTSTLAIVAAPLLVQGLVSLGFLWLHVDRGGQLHWSPFD